MAVAESVVIQQPISNAGDQAHIDAMVAKADGQVKPEVAPEVPAEEQPQRPSWLPEKFKNEEEFAKAYAELEAKQGGKPADPPTEVAPELNPDGTPKVPEVPVEDEAAKALAAKGLDLAEFSKEFSASGALAPESYAKLEAAGYPKSLVDQYIAGQQAIAVTYEADIKAAAGGPEQFDLVASWAAESLTDPEKAAYNAAIDSGNADQAKLAVAGLAAKYAAANPTEGNLIGGRTTSSVGDAYQSTAEMTKDMASPEYNRDPAFRKKVMDKIQRSTIL